MNAIYKILSLPHFGVSAPCGGGGFLTFPTWYEYIPGTNTSGGCTPQLTHITDVWLILAAIIEILLRVAGIAAVVIIIYAGVQYTVSSGNPEQTGRALNTIIYAAVGLLICILSAVLVSFIAGSFN